MTPTDDIAELFESLAGFLNEGYVSPEANVDAVDSDQQSVPTDQA